MSDTFIPFSTKFFTALEAFLVYSFSISEVDGKSAAPGRASPKASPNTCIVAAVPIKEQAPQLGHAFSL
ncbi:hypothetical protein D3C73_933230 [compost metagenome]